MYRYSKADSYKDSDGHGRVDLPHVVIMMATISEKDGAWVVK